jgi:threonyl-tRNA synthetase
LIEHYAGAFPAWLAPVQAVLIPIADRHLEFCEQVAARLRAVSLRPEVDSSSERMGKKIAVARDRKIPYMLIVGDREVEAGAVALRLRSGDDRGAMAIEEFISYARRVVDDRGLE